MLVFEYSEFSKFRTPFHPKNTQQSEPKKLIKYTIDYAIRTSAMRLVWISGNMTQRTMRLLFDVLYISEHKLNYLLLSVSTVVYYVIETKYYLFT